MTPAPFAPMLATPRAIPDPADYPRILAEYVVSPHHDLTQKADGWRLVVVVEDGKVSGINRRGAFTGVIKPIAERFGRLAGTYVFDGELIGDTYYVFDLPVAGESIEYASPYLERRERLENFFLPGLWDPGPAVQLIPSARTVEDKERLVRRLIATTEGFVAKRLDSPYMSGARSPDWIKLKRTKDVDCVVIDAGRDGKKNLTLGLYDETGELVEVGQVSSLTGTGSGVLIYPNKPLPVVTVRYLAWTGKRLREPTVPRLRHDKDPNDCTMAQVATQNTRSIASCCHIGPCLATPCPTTPDRTPADPAAPDRAVPHLGPPQLATEQSAYLQASNTTRETT